MADKAFIEIIEISKSQKASKFKPGELYWDVKVTDGKTRRKVTVFGDWGKDWKLGDVVEVIWQTNDYEKDGVIKSGWKIVDPNAKPTSPRPAQPVSAAVSSAPNMVNAFMIAATAASTIFKNTEKVTLDMVEALAKAVMVKLQAATPVAPVAAAPAVAEPAAPVAPVVTQTQTAAAPVATVDTTPKLAESDFEEDEEKLF